MQNIAELIAEGKRILTFKKHDIKDYCDVISDPDAEFVLRWIDKIKSFQRTQHDCPVIYHELANNMYVIDNHNRLASKRVNNIIEMLESIK